MSETTIVDAPTSSRYFSKKPHSRSLPVHLARTGRPKGTKNKLSVDAMWIVDEVHRMAGGIEAMAEWAKRNRTDFYKAWIKARVPRPTVEQSDDGQATVHVHFLITDTKDTKAIDVSPSQQSLSSPNKPIVSKAK